MSFNKIVAALDSPNESVRMEAVMNLSRNIDMRAVSLLMKVCKSDESLEVRFCAKKALSLYRDKIVRAKKRQTKAMVAVKVDDIPTSRPKEVSDKGETLSPQVARDFAALKSSSAEARIKAITSLVQVTSPKVAEKLRDQYKVDTDVKVRSALLIALGLLKNIQDLHLLVDALPDENYSIRTSALEGLRLMKSPIAVRHIIKYVRDDNRKVRNLSVEVLRALPVKELLSEFRELMSSSDSTIRDLTMYALFKLQKGESLPLVVAGMSDESMSVRLKARNTLVQMAKNGVKEAQDALASSTGKKRSSPDAYLTMSTIEGVPAFDPLKAPSSRERLAAISSIVENNETEKVSSILSALIREKDAYVRSSLILALGRLKAQEAVSTLEVFLTDSDNRIRANAVEALGLMNDPEIYPRLIPSLEDTNNRVLANAIIALGNCPYIQLDTPVQRMFSSSEILMRRSLVYVLVELRQAKYIHFLGKLLHDKEDIVRARATDGLELLSQEGFEEASAILAKGA